MIMGWSVGEDNKRDRDIGYKFYVYLWLREDGTPYYVGKGSGNRAYKKRRCGNPPRNRVFVMYVPSEQEALETEIKLIAFYGRKDQKTGCLVNLTDGGENPPNHKGKKRGVEWLRKQSEVKSNRKRPRQSEETCRKRSIALKGRTFSDESIERMRVAQIGKTVSLETRKKLSLAIKRYYEEKRKCLGQ